MFYDHKHDDTYLHALNTIIECGEERHDRTGVGTKSVFGMVQRYNLEDGFPAVTTKKLAWKAVVSELLWFIEGSSDERRLAEILHGTRGKEKKTIWTANAQADYWVPKARYVGDTGRTYGVQWRSWQTGRFRVGRGETPIVIDQLAVLIEGLQRDPHGRRHIITAWNPGELDQMALPPCHCFAQFYVHNDGRLDCTMYQRSNDFFLGGPFNIASYSLFTTMIAQCCGLRPGTLIHVSGDAHVYLNHIDQVKEQLARTPYPSPQLRLNPSITNINDFTMDDIELDGYQSHPAISAPMAV